jgi:proline dehydrogenase
MLSRALLSLAGNKRVKKIVTDFPPIQPLVHTYVAGEQAADVVSTTATLSDRGLQITIDHLGEDAQTTEQASRNTQAYLELLDQLRRARLSGQADVSVKLSAIGAQLGSDAALLAIENARVICTAAQNAGSTLTIDMEDHTTTDDVLSVVSKLRQEFSWVGAVLQAYLRRTESDCRDLAIPGSRIRLCKGAYSEPGSVAYTASHDIDKSYVRCLKVLMSGPGYPMVATHDPRLIPIAENLALRSGRAEDSYEFQMLYGIRPAEQRRLAGLGHQMRIYLPYGTDWYGYLVRRLAERPAFALLFARSLISRR